MKCVKIYSRRKIKICNKWNYFKPFLMNLQPYEDSYNHQGRKATDGA